MSRERDLTNGLEALRLIAQGRSTVEIARELHLALDTIKGRLRRLYGLLGARNAAHAVAIAGMERLLSAEDLLAALGNRRVGWKPEEEA